MPTARASWGGALASKTHDFAGTPVTPPENSPPVRTPWAPGAPVLAAAARAVDEVASSGRSAETALAAHEGDAHRAAVRAIALGTIRWYLRLAPADRKSTRLNSSHGYISYAVFCLKKKNRLPA